ncbi:class I SAM-dependent methyltransferase [Phenylobacterium sp.]|jgi:SAM-dependent methyltransferase|uniref:class I SAM-dependent methyltransferase n=1 Tax=Phenylobacterium sp. TaxID=1871053 RepID=UPI002E335867|nr:class I SAM-dependent methyltransferase [Phenylobacterium sp.]HEX2559686.1 class I SAM-dependent methyltransferase [Phenylobacterium sp.]
MDRATWITMGDDTVNGMFVQAAGLPRDGHVLDVGCGCGKIPRALVGYLSAEGSYHGMDIGAEVIDWCRGAYSDYPNFHFHHADLYSARYNPEGRHKPEKYRFPIASRSIDLVFLGSVFTHLLPAATNNYLREISRVLRPGGQVIATYFVIDEEARASLENGRAQPPLPFTLPDGSGCRVANPKVPEAAIGYEEAYLRQAYRKAGLEGFRVSQGRWGRGEIVPHWQDEVWARKPAEGSWVQRMFGKAGG